MEASSVVVNSIVEGGISIGKESVVSHCHLQVLRPNYIPSHTYASIYLTNLPIYLPTNCPSYQPTNLPTYPPTYQLTYLSTSLVCLANKSCAHLFIYLAA